MLWVGPLASCFWLFLAYYAVGWSNFWSHWSTCLKGVDPFGFIHWLPWNLPEIYTSILYFKMWFNIQVQLLRNFRNVSCILSCFRTSSKRRFLSIARQSLVAILVVFSSIPSCNPKLSFYACVVTLPFTTISFINSFRNLSYFSDYPNDVIC